MSIEIEIVVRRRDSHQPRPVGKSARIVVTAPCEAPGKAYRDMVAKDIARLARELLSAHKGA